MKALFISSIALLLVSLYLFISSNNGTIYPVDEAKPEIENNTKNIVVWFNNNQLDSIVNLYRNDACALPNNCCGKECIKENLRIEKLKGYTFKEISTLSLNISDTIAIEKGEWVINFPKGPEIKGMYLTEWRLTNNKWLIVNDMSGIKSINPY